MLNAYPRTNIMAGGNCSRAYVILGLRATPRKGYFYDPSKESDYQLKYLKNVKKRCAQIH